MRLYPALMTSVLLTGCLGTFMTPSRDTLTPVNRPSTRAASPKTGASPAASTPVSVGTAVALPSTVRLEMPSNVISTGGGNVIGTGGLNVIGTGGLNVISTGGGNVISTGGGNVISTGGGNFRVQQNGIAGLQILQAIEKYHDLTQQIDKLLKAISSLPLEAGKTLTAKDPAGKVLTVRVDKKATYHLLTMSTEAQASGDGQELRMSFASPRKGRVVLRARKGANQWRFATEFDLDAGRVTADRATDYNLTSGAVDLGHWEFQRYATPANGKAFAFKQWAYDDRPGQGDTRITLANFLSDDRAVLVYGGREPDGSWFFLHPTDAAADKTQLHAHYLNAKGDATASGTGAAELQAHVPTESEFKALATADPSTGTPLDRPAFTFPE